MLKPAPLTDRQKALLAQFERAGGVIDHHVLTYEGSTTPDPSLLRHAAILGMELERQQSLEYARDLHKKDMTRYARVSVANGWTSPERAEELLGEGLEEGLRKAIASGSIWTVKIDADAAAGIAEESISIDEFLGPCYVRETAGLLMPLRKTGSMDSGHMAGYAYAFAEPPYSLQLAQDETQEMFEAFVEHFLFGLGDNVLIHSWPVDWSNYFDAGREWWGSFLWTVAHPPSRKITWIGASTTD